MTRRQHKQLRFVRYALRLFPDMPTYDLSAHGRRNLTSSVLINRMLWRRQPANRLRPHGPIPSTFRVVVNVARRPRVEPWPALCGKNNG